MKRKMELIVAGFMAKFGEVNTRLFLYRSYGITNVNLNGEIRFGSGVYSFPPTSGQLETMVLALADNFKMDMETFETLQKEAVE